MGVSVSKPAALFMSVMFVLSMVCIVIYAFKPNNLIMQISFGSFLIGMLTPIFIAIYRGELKILTE